VSDSPVSDPGSPINSQVIHELAIHQLERLAYLQLSDQDRAGLVGDLNKILDFANSIQSLDLAEYPPMTHVMDQANVLRPDQRQPGSTVQQALSNAPQAQPPYYRVPQVLD